MNFPINNVCIITTGHTSNSWNLFLKPQRPAKKFHIFLWADLNKSKGFKIGILFCLFRINSRPDPRPYTLKQKKPKTFIGLRKRTFVSFHFNLSYIFPYTGAGCNHSPVSAKPSTNYLLINMNSFAL